VPVSESPHAAPPQAPESEDRQSVPALVRVLPAQPPLPAQRGSQAAVQAVAVAAGGFVAGAAVAGLVHRRGRRSARPSRRRRAGTGGRAAELVEIVGSRSLLVDVHLLGGPGER